MENRFLHSIAALNPIISIASLKFLARADRANFLQFAIEVTAILLFSQLSKPAQSLTCMNGLVWNDLSLASLYLHYDLFVLEYTGISMCI